MTNFSIESILRPEEDERWEPIPKKVWKVAEEGEDEEVEAVWRGEEHPAPALLLRPPGPLLTAAPLLTPLPDPLYSTWLQHSTKPPSIFFGLQGLMLAVAATVHYLVE